MVFAVAGLLRSCMSLLGSAGPGVVEGGGWGRAGLLGDGFLLHQDSQVAAAHLVCEEIEGSTKSALNAKKFITYFCAPLKMAEEWIARKTTFRIEDD